MSRADTIRYLTRLSEADRDRICDRLQQCNVRLVRTDGSIEGSNDRPRGPTSALEMLKADPTIERFEYFFSGGWRVLG